ncbi:MAG: hypothetical protein MGG11_18050 [Trichodesmium sp. MAG_R03]|nr:hypothetical protein [Trichodesmium sp. MAG_R03]
MLWKKNYKKEVFFTEEAADKQLLAAIEKELNVQKYQTFSNLCKQAIWQFLYLSSSTELAQSASNFQRLEQRIYELAKQFTASKKNEYNQINQLNDMKKHLSQMNEQLTQMQLYFDTKLISALEGFKIELSKTKAGINQVEIPIVNPNEELELTTNRPKQVEEDLSVKQPITESDPLLKHLTSLIEDF